MKVKTLVIAALALGLSAGTATAQRRLPPTRLVPAPEASVDPAAATSSITCMDLQQYCYQWEYMYETSTRTLCDSPKHDGLEPCPKPTKQQLDASVDSHDQITANGTLAPFKDKWESLPIFHGMSYALFHFFPLDPYIARDSCRAVCQEDPTATGMPDRLISYIQQNYGNSSVH